MHNTCTIIYTVVMKEGVAMQQFSNSLSHFHTLFLVDQCERVVREHGEWRES